MPRERALSEAKEPHFVILKVLRLCRPTLSTHATAPLPTTPSLPTAPSLLAPIPAEDDTFPLQPLLTLPPSFGNVFIGETFRCCLHASITSELPDGVNVSDVRVEAEMQTPTQKLGLELTGEDARIVEFELKEEGLHVLAVTVSYLQSLAVPPLPESGKTTSIAEKATATIAARERSFRKLYQFTSSHCLLIRTKATLLPSPSPSQSLILEAQIENVSDSPLVLSELTLNGARPAKTLYHNDDGDRAMPLKSRDVVQVAFLVGEEEEGERETKDKGIGQLVLRWRSACGELGVLRTGRLGAPASVVG
ncbi:hypothetical protein EX30DRAFT_332255 [Ascodesmis nigricans]|uniref:DUF974-domain-containing protein n=1 Tax=Ascodesmis nigricans TaxID=341454 RepID=A0A4S2MUU5_9PEZI|nr:hypothetical protein EX30DRAFT_332255 [Ascodesmis nigricans]